MNILSPEVVAESLSHTKPYQAVTGRWSTKKANSWYEGNEWLSGTNYYPATAINQIDMWQASSWDPETIEKELKMSQKLGFNTQRVYLHDLVWADDEAGLYDRMDQFLDICQRTGHKPMFVFFDDCHYPIAKLGEQPLPVPAWHNSGWLTCPERSVAISIFEQKETSEDLARLKGYVQQTMKRFANDDRVLLWELYNEPGRGAAVVGELDGDLEVAGFGDHSRRLVHESWVWAREVNPSQPITSTTDGCVGDINYTINMMNSDVHSIHNYGKADSCEKLIDFVAEQGRPIFMTEYVAREQGSTFQDIMPLLRRKNVAAINWGFVSGKSGTIWPWHSRNRDGKFVDSMELRAKGDVIRAGEAYPEPELWFHDIYRIDGTPFDEEEVRVIKATNQRG